MISFNKPYLTGKETEYIHQAVDNMQLSGNGEFTRRCQCWFEERYGFGKCLLTTSCTDALEMAAMLCELKEGDEVIVPSYTFVSTALAFVREGARIVFADSEDNHPNMDVRRLEELITPRTRVIVPVHYAGMACDMGAIMALADKYDLLVVEDAAQAIDGRYRGRTLGSIGHLAAFSFHETKNVIAGEGGMLVVNDERLRRRAEIIWEKGTNRAEFFRGEVARYSWVDVGSSFLPSEVTAAFLWAQLEHVDEIQSKRWRIWDRYYECLRPLSDRGCFSLPIVPESATNNYHIFYLLCGSLVERTDFIEWMRSKGVECVSHYVGLHRSPYYADKHDGRVLRNCDRYTDCLVRLPLYAELSVAEVDMVCDLIKEFYR